MYKSKYIALKATLKLKHLPLNTHKDSEPILVLEHNIRRYYELFNEYQRFKLLRVPPVSSSPPSEPPLTLKRHIHSVHVFQK